jgi:hypothetical protein
MQSPVTTRFTYKTLRRPSEQARCLPFNSLCHSSTPPFISQSQRIAAARVPSGPVDVPPARRARFVGNVRMGSQSSDEWVESVFMTGTMPVFSGRQEACLTYFLGDVSMHCRELAELAALVAVHAPTLIEGRGGIPPNCNQEYWVASKCRLDRWGRLLRKLQADAAEVRPSAALAWPRVRPVLEEILATELLTRLWTAIAVAYDTLSGSDELTAVAHNVFTGHLDARTRLLALIADGRAIALPQGVQLNHLRRRCERWTDMLLAHFTRHIDVARYAFEVDRAHDFADDLDHESAHVDQRFTCQLVLASLRASFAYGLADHSPNADLNQRIGNAVLSAFREEIADSTGLVKSVWLERIARTASDTELMIEELVRLDRN